MSAFVTSPSAGPLQQAAPQRQYEPFGHQVRQAMADMPPHEGGQMIHQGAPMQPSGQPGGPPSQASSAPRPRAVSRVTNTTSVVNNTPAPPPARQTQMPGNVNHSLPPAVTGKPPSFEAMQRSRQELGAVQHFNAMSQLGMIR